MHKQVRVPFIKRWKDFPICGSWHKGVIVFMLDKNYDSAGLAYAPGDLVDAPDNAVGVEARRIFFE